LYAHDADFSLVNKIFLFNVVSSTLRANLDLYEAACYGADYGADITTIVRQEVKAVAQGVSLANSIKEDLVKSIGSRVTTHSWWIESYAMEDFLGMIRASVFDRLISLTNRDEVLEHVTLWLATQMPNLHKTGRNQYADAAERIREAAEVSPVSRREVAGNEMVRQYLFTELLGADISEDVKEMINILKGQGDTFRPYNDAYKLYYGLDPNSGNELEESDRIILEMVKKGVESALNEPSDGDDLMGLLLNLLNIAANMTGAMLVGGSLCGLAITYAVVQRAFPRRSPSNRPPRTPSGSGNDIPPESGDKRPDYDKKFYMKRAQDGRRTFAQYDSTNKLRLCKDEGISWAGGENCQTYVNRDGWEELPPGVKPFMTRTERVPRPVRGGALTNQAVSLRPNGAGRSRHVANAT